MHPPDTAPDQPSIDQILATAISPPVLLPDGNIVAARRPGGGEYTLCVAVTPYQRARSRPTPVGGGVESEDGLDQRGSHLPAGFRIPIPTAALAAAPIAAARLYTGRNSPPANPATRPGPPEHVRPRS